MQRLLEEILLLQPDWSWRNTPAMERRGLLIRREVVAWLRARLPELSTLVLPGVDDLRVEGRDGIGKKTEIPWVRVHSAVRSPSATVGWDVVYLFSADGEHVYVSLNQGTTRWENGVSRARPSAELHARVAWARQQLVADLALRPDLLDDIMLAARSSALGPGYERGNVAAFAYPIDAIPSENSLETDLRFMVSVLGKLYTAADRALELPGEPAPEIADAVTAIEQAAGRRPRAQGSRLTAAERSAIERRAVQVSMEHLVGQGYTKVKDVGATESYDIDARKGDERLFIEVKGTTSVGVEMILTKTEVDLHIREHPNTALFVVAAISLNRDVDPPAASAGELRVMQPWKIDEQDLAPIAYRYTVPRSR